MFKMDVLIQIPLLVAAVNLGNGFLFDNDCPAPLPCTCQSTNIECGHSHLIDVPVFRNTSARIAVPWTLNLYGNIISSISADAFLALNTFSDNNSLHLLLGSNNLSDGNIDSNAFRGIENLVGTLILSDNNFESIPAAVGKLRNLKELRIDDNPISTVDPHIFISIGHTLKFLAISPAYVQQWPVAFHYLVALEKLIIQNYKDDIPFGAFQGFRNTLKSLVLSMVRFKYIPLAVCSLSHLESLEIAFDDTLSGTNLVHCPSPMASVKSLTFQHTGIQKFPALFTTFPNMQLLYISFSNLSYIDDSVIPTNSNLTTFSVTDSHLAVIPGAVNAFPLLIECNLSRNEIRTIEWHSIENLQHLTTLNLDDNPIVFVSKLAFLNLRALSHLSLQRTKLTTIPQAVEMLPSLSKLELQHNQILCNCDFAWMKHWVSSTKVIVNGTCNLSAEIIRDFLNVTLPLCP